MWERLTRLILPSFIFTRLNSSGKQDKHAEWSSPEFGTRRKRNDLIFDLEEIKMSQEFFRYASVCLYPRQIAKKTSGNNKFNKRNARSQVGGCCTGWTINNKVKCES